MNITLIRHGRSVWTKRGWLTREQFCEWIERYDASGVCEDDDIPMATREKARDASILFVSPLLRSRHSAELLCPSCPIEQSALFSEVPLPDPPKWLKGKYPLFLWFLIMRFLWLIGFGDEPYIKAKQRAKQAAETLVNHAANGHVVVIGHGLFNHLLSKSLRKHGFYARKVRWKHWEAVTFERRS
ncbi:broad specificity phosphatase PhoE [Thermolongibacillus altinsuensis]|uniref:Broad specificity phosphatase PhoE n=1 Tax=Thermolongibacillus altinsuensis TaxID=575256 RepID=A0A4R1QGI6_9BACL|nr:histidine phosphatase family protein [Thermolongibacillus altinsuensis]TCL48399.1 broad specificity phosphatase PhoE [Thermolongibacillus altinsuensis]